MMGVYVDDMRSVIRNKNWPYPKACHLMADSVKELHIFARKLSLKRRWFQSNTIPHYDLTESKRKQSLRFGAIPISDKRLVEMIQEYRQKGVD